MVLKKFSQALEGVDSLKTNSSRNFFLIEGREGSLTGLERLPPKLLLRAKVFSRKNSLVAVASRLKDKRIVYRCCERCLKAHLVGEASRMELGKEVEKVLRGLFDCELGHEGYYLDGGKLRRV